MDRKAPGGWLSVIFTASGPPSGLWLPSIHHQLTVRVSYARGDCCVEEHSVSRLFTGRRWWRLRAPRAISLLSRPFTAAIRGLPDVRTSRPPFSGMLRVSVLATAPRCPLPRCAHSTTCGSPPNCHGAPSGTGAFSPAHRRGMGGLKGGRVWEGKAKTLMVRGPLRAIKCPITPPAARANKRTTGMGGRPAWYGTREASWPGTRVVRQPGLAGLWAEAGCERCCSQLQASCPGGSQEACICAREGVYLSAGNQTLSLTLALSPHANCRLSFLALAGFVLVPPGN
ncbi:hypothetical protein BD413DRAFT_287576 [Trametes elegans]|nr:hypothetical protein BD413DRAFT_287576 [Trametes elegans]